MEIFKQPDVKSYQTPAIQSDDKHEDSLSNHYLVENKTGKGSMDTKMLDNFTGTSEQLFKRVRGLLLLPEFDITIEYLDTIMSEYLPFTQDMEISKLPRVTVLRVIKAS